MPPPWVSCPVLLPTCFLKLLLPKGGSVCPRSIRVENRLLIIDVEELQGQEASLLVCVCIPKSGGPW